MVTLTDSCYEHIRALLKELLETVNKQHAELNNTVQIEKGVPIQKQRKLKYPFEDMEVGDSFAVASTSSTVTTAANTFCKKDGRGKEFTCRREGDKVRCWRTK